MSGNKTILDRAHWYASRLRSMPLPELPHRFAEAVKQRVDRRGGSAIRYAQAPEGVRQLPVPAFPIDLNALCEAGEGDRARIGCQAREILDGNVVLLGQRWPAGSRTDWALDPESGKHWEWDRLCFDIDRRLDHGPGDVKFTWELSRLQHLQILALDAFLSGNRASRRACLGDLREWIEGNPPYRGLGYACGIELSSRVISLLMVIALLGAASFPADLSAAIWDMLHAHGAWLARYPSLYSAANNHLIAEAGGLFALGSLAPQLPEASAWRAMGQEHLEREAARQITSDGVGAEQSPTYQAYSMEWLLVSRRIAAATGQKLAAVIGQRLLAGANFLASILDEDGNHPRLGDDDEGVVLRQEMARERTPLSIAGTVGALFGEASCCHPAYRLGLRARILGARSLPANDWHSQSATFTHGGYTVLRSGGMLALFDHGPLGYSYTAGHGHADALSIWLHIGGTPLLVDAGTYRYNHDAGWRRHLRGTTAHNTITIDGKDQSEQTGPFNWGKRAQAHLICSELGDEPTATASHDGYSVLGITHERTVSLKTDSLKKDTLRLTDRVGGSGRHHVRLTLQFATGLRVDGADENHWRVRSAQGAVADVEVKCASLAGHVIEQTAEPGAGAVSAHYNGIAAAPALLVEGEASLPLKIVTVISTPSGQAN